jgi:4-hydroxybenzoate polyprenyltransferase
MNQTVFRQLRALLALGRVSHLPTVWSNCLAGWWLGGHGNFSKLPLLFLGVSALYTGGMFLNDAFDADFDRSAARNGRSLPARFRCQPSGAGDWPGLVWARCV